MISRGLRRIVICKLCLEEAKILDFFGENTFLDILRISSYACPSDCLSDRLVFTITLERSDRLTSNCAQGNIIVFFRSCSNMGYIGPQLLVPPHVIKFTPLQINFCQLAYSINLLLSVYHRKIDFETASSGIPSI